jgi:AI-2 transport protein TqsA
MNESQGRTLVSLLAVAVVILVGAALKATYYVTLPLVFAFFVAVVVWPLHEALERRLPPRAQWLATVASMLVVAVALGGFVGGAAFILYRVGSDRASDLLERWSSQQQALADWLSGHGLPAPEGEGSELLARAADWLGTAALSLTGLLTLLVLVLFFVLLMLVEARRWHEKTRVAFAPEQAGTLLDAVAATTRQVRRFLVVQALVSLATAIATGLWLWALGVPLVLLWSLLTFLVDFVPNVGPIVAGVLVSLVALVTLGWQRAIVTGLGVLAIQQVFGNYINPLLQGRHLAISPLVVLFSVVFWAWVWGPAGAILAVPITATLIVACAHVEALRPLALLLSRTADEEQLEKQTRGR